MHANVLCVYSAANSTLLRSNSHIVCTMYMFYSCVLTPIQFIDKIDSAEQYHFYTIRHRVFFFRVRFTTSTSRYVDTLWELSAYIILYVIF